MCIYLFTWLCNKQDNVHSALQAWLYIIFYLKYIKFPIITKVKLNKTLIYVVLAETKQMTYWKLVVISSFPVSIATPSSKETKNNQTNNMEKKNITTIS